MHVYTAESAASKPPPKPKEKAVKKAADGATKKPAAKKTTATKKKPAASGMFKIYCRYLQDRGINQLGYSFNFFKKAPTLKTHSISV